MDHGLSVILMADDRGVAARITGALEAAGHEALAVVQDFATLAERIAWHAPDAVIVHVATLSRETLEGLIDATGPRARPVAVFVDRSAGDVTDAAVAAGICAYAVDGFAPHRVGPVLATALARFRLLHGLRTELAETKGALADRKVIDRAKGLIMSARGVDENAAYALMRKTAMDQGKRIADVAHALVSAAGLLS